MIRIAIVDDEREILELLFRIIDDTLKREQAQFEITTFLKAEELLSSHREKPFQIIFADLEMPDVDGLHLAAEVFAGAAVYGAGCLLYWKLAGRKDMLRALRLQRKSA